MWITAPLANALVAVLLLAGLPFLGYFIWHSWRHKRGFAEIARRAGLQGSDTRHLLISVAVAALVVCALLLWQPPMAPFMSKGSPQQAFVGLGWGMPAIVMALLYGAAQTGFVEELVFRGLIA